MKSKLSKIILLMTLAILPTAFAQAQTTKKTKKKVKTKRTTKNVKPLVPDKITVAPNTLKSKSEVAFTIGAAKPEPASNTFKTETINKFDIASIDVPSNMIAEPVKEETKKNGEVEWITYKQVWKTPLAKTSPDPSLKVDISTNIYEDFTKVVPEIPANKVTPELLLQMEHFANVNSVKQFPDKIKDVKMLNLNGTDGTYVLFNGFNAGFVTVWQTYRRIDGKMQILTLTVESVPAELSKAEQIVKSFKLAAK